MAEKDGFLHTTTRTISWLQGAHDRGELNLKPPFQRNPVWSESQKSYLIGTILKGYPIPELYMQDSADELGKERHDVVDGQQRIRACLEFLAGDFPLNEEDFPEYSEATFDDLPGDVKKAIFAYKFVVRTLPEMDGERLREIFRRLNRNVVALTRQELRHATYWGPFIKCIEWMSDNDEYWADCGVFTANDHRRMLDQEFISELVVAFLHGPQEKKKKLESYYRLYEREFVRQDEVRSVFMKVTGELAQVLPDIALTRWKQRSDFYTLFLVLASEAKRIPFSADARDLLASKLRDFGQVVNAVLAMDEDEREALNPATARYVRGVVRAASDRANRIRRSQALANVLFDAELPASPDDDHVPPERELELDEFPPVALEE